MSKLKGAFVFLSVFVYGVFLAAPAYGAEVVVPAASDNGNVVLGAAETHKNLYTAGGNVAINSNVSGDLVVAGGMVSVNGTVQQELLAAGGNILISGSVGGHARVAGGNITIEAPVGGDLVVAGGNVNITGKASVAGDLLVAGGNVIIDAPITGNVQAAGGTVTINGRVGGKLDVIARKGLVFGSGAEVLGPITYKGPQEASVASGAKLGQIQYTQMTSLSRSAGFFGLLTLAFLVKLLAWLIAGFVIIKMKKSLVPALVAEFVAKPWANLGIGALALIATPIAAILLLFTIVGYYLAVILAFSYILLLIISSLLSALVIGYWLLGKMTKAPHELVDWQALLIGVVVWAVLAIIPFLGWLAIAVVLMMVMGTVLKKLKLSLQN